MTRDSLHDRFIPDAIDLVFQHDYADTVDAATLTSVMERTVACLAHAFAE